MKYILIFLAIISLSFCAHAQKNNMASFEQKLADFKYSFYAVLSKIDTSESIKKESFEKIKTFLAQNDKEIKQYKANRLEKFLQEKLDLSSYKEDSANAMQKNFSLDIKTLNQRYHQDDVATMFDLATIQPDLFFFGLVNTAHIQRLRDLDMSLITISRWNALASPKERVIKKGDTYQIVWDFYTVVYVVDYDINGNNFSNIKMYERKEEK